MWAGQPVLHKGQKMTVAAALPVLLKLVPQANMHRRLLGCAHQPFGHVPDARLAKSTPSFDWSVCPLDLLTDPAIKGVFTLDRLAKVAPLSNWPGAFAVWAVDGLLLLRQLRGE